MNPVSPNWQLCRLSAPPEHADAAANWLLEHGCEGVQIEDTTLVFDQSEDATLVKREEVLLTGYRVENASETPEDLARALSELPFEADLHIEAVQSHDWANEWRENFPPLEIGRFLIVPSWESVDETDRIKIQLDPGLAFGTGQHPTTRMCLELLGEVLDGSEIRLLDVGCGSGILSVAAAKLGARVVASDLDPFCTAATKENAALNFVDEQIEVDGRANLHWVTEPFPFVVANLMSDLLIRLAPELSRVTKSTLVISGISAPRAKEVEAALHAVGFSTVKHREMDGEARGDYVERWAAFVLRKN